GLNGVDLVAVGGFGRGEMHPQSDVDLLILVDEHVKGAVSEDCLNPSPNTDIASALEGFIQQLWDAGLSVGQSVRSVSECVEQAAADAVIATNLMEARSLAGNGELFSAMQTATAAPAIWPADAFFSAKLAEQRKRHQRFEDTIYNLEPNLKSGPGGLRDIQMIGWVARRHFGVSSLHGLVEQGFLTEREYAQLSAAQRTLWQIRWALHQLADRAEERLLFDYQSDLARHFITSDEDAHALVERFMQSYYRTAIDVERLNEQLLQLFDEELLVGRRHLPSADISDEFRQHHGYIEVVDPQQFERKPEWLLQLFLVLADHPEVRGVRASTIRLIRKQLDLVDQDFRQNPAHLALFLELLRKPRRVYAQLERMNRYGVLAAFIPGFAQITGRMQFDLFHVYTVDQHILFVIRNLRRIARRRQADQFARPSAVFEQVQAPELLYLAALFHDIAKGRAGDHSVLGAVDARQFVDQLPLSDEQRDLVVWLVEQHLLMSLTAQQQDVSDPSVIDAFARLVTSLDRLRYLYILTVADIAATRPRLWTGWKDALLWQLYKRTLERLDEGLDTTANADHRFNQRSADARRLLADLGPDDAVDPAQLDRLWSSLPDAQLNAMEADQLAWCSRCILNQPRDDEHYSVQSRRLASNQISELLVYGPDFKGLFATVAHELDRMQLNVLSARIATSLDQQAWNLYQLVDGQSKPLNPSDARRLETTLSKQLSAGQLRPLNRQGIPRRLRPFMQSPMLDFSERTAAGVLNTQLSLKCTDRPGLLSMIAAAMLEADVRLLDARVATFGQQVEDVFLVVDDSGQALQTEQIERLRSALLNRLDIQ
ncbi:MAG: [protein-PII] uridylyltransferase, partial [Pseudomonadota bacterium]